VWRPCFACPECRTPAVEDGEGGHQCRACGAGFPLREGIHRFLTPERAAAAEPFARQYRLVRQRDGHRETSAEFYRRLPVVDRGQPGAAEWAIRRESYARLQARVLAATRQGPARILDVGAGNGWLSFRLTSLGHWAVAVDRLDDEADGLGACRHYPVMFPVVQADFDALPFESSQFDVAVMNASLHYAADPSATLTEVRRTVVPGGALVVMDSPMFVSECDGRAMVEDQDRAMSAACNLTTVVRPGPGFLTLDTLDRAAAQLGMRGRFYRSSGAPFWRLRRQVARLRLRRHPARFGLWVAR